MKFWEVVIIKNKLKVAKQINRLLQLATEDLSESQALEVPDLFEEWKADAEYEKDKVLKYGEIDGVSQLYKVIQAHTSQEDWIPDENAALYKNFGFKGEYEIWVQPLGATDSYKKDFIVSHKDILYKSTIDNNIWEPGVYGWEIYTN